MIKRCIKQILLGIMKTFFGILSLGAMTIGIYMLVFLNRTSGWFSVEAFFAAILLCIGGFAGFYIVGRKKK